MIVIFRSRSSLSFLTRHLLATHPPQEKGQSATDRYPAANAETCRGCPLIRHPFGYRVGAVGPVDPNPSHWPAGRTSVLRG
jgi:hypothetical protein